MNILNMICRISTSNASSTMSSLLYGELISYWASSTKEESIDITELSERLSTPESVSLRRVEKAANTERFIEYLKEEAYSTKCPSVKVALKAESFWLDIKSEFGESVPSPVISLGPDRSVQFSWQTEGHDFELDITDETYSFYDDVSGEEEEWPISGVQDPLSHEKVRSALSAIFKHAAVFQHSIV